MITRTLLGSTNTLTAKPLGQNEAFSAKNTSILASRTLIHDKTAACKTKLVILHIDTVVPMFHAP